MLRSTNGGGRVDGRAVAAAAGRRVRASPAAGRARSSPTSRAGRTVAGGPQRAQRAARRAGRVRRRRMPAPPKPPDTSVEARKNGLPGLLATEREMLAKRIADAPAMWISIPMWGRVFNAYRKLLRLDRGSDDHHPGERRPHRRPLDADASTGRRCPSSRPPPRSRSRTSRSAARRTWSRDPRRPRGVRRGPVAADVPARARAVLARASELLMERHDELAETHHAGGRHADQADDALARHQRARHVRRARRDGRDLPVGGDPRRHALAGRDPAGAGRRRRRDRALERPASH